MGFPSESYEKEFLTPTDKLIDIVTDCGRHQYHKFAFELKVPLKEVDDINVTLDQNRQRLHRIIQKWMDGKRVTRGQLLMACKRAKVYGAVETEVMTLLQSI